MPCRVQSNGPLIPLTANARGMLSFTPNVSILAIFTRWSQRGYSRHGPGSSTSPDTRSATPPQLKLCTEYTHVTLSRLCPATHYPQNERPERVFVRPTDSALDPGATTFPCGSNTSIIALHAEKKILKIPRFRRSFP